MSMSGVVLHPDCIARFKEIQTKQKYRYILFAIADKKEIKPVKMGERNKTYNDFLKALPPKDPCYALVDVSYTSKSGQSSTKVCFIFWTPDTCSNVKDKMIYASSKDALKKGCPGIQLEVQASEHGDIPESELQARLQKGV